MDVLYFMSKNEQNRHCTSSDYRKTSYFDLFLRIFHQAGFFPKIKLRHIVRVLCYIIGNVTSRQNIVRADFAENPGHRDTHIDTRG